MKNKNTNALNNFLENILCSQAKVQELLEDRGYTFDEGDAIVVSEMANNEGFRWIEGKTAEGKTFEGWVDRDGEMTDEEEAIFELCRI